MAEICGLRLLLVAYEVEVTMKITLLVLGCRGVSKECKSKLLHLLNAWVAEFKDVCDVPLSLNKFLWSFHSRAMKQMVIGVNNVASSFGKLNEVDWQPRKEKSFEALSASCPLCRHYQCLHGRWVSVTGDYA